MGMAMTGLGGIFCLVGFVCYVVVLIQAFKESVGQGIGCLLCGFYGLYYMFAKFQHPKKGLIIAGTLGGNIIGNVLMGIGRSQSARM